jgi:transcriptional regulator with XRE-family HTH domain
MSETLIDVNVLRSLREARGWDQATLAAHAGIDPSVISRLERGLQVDLKASVLASLARALQIPVDALLAAPYRQHPAALAPELDAAIAQLSALAPAQQRQVAALLQAYLRTLPA